MSDRCDHVDDAGKPCELIRRDKYGDAQDAFSAKGKRGLTPCACGKTLCYQHNRGKEHACYWAAVSRVVRYVWHSIGWRPYRETQVS